MIDKVSLSQQIKAYALELGFDACGFSKAEHVGGEESRLRNWLDAGFNAGMGYMENHFEKRCNPVELIEGARSVISLALNYYPREFQTPSVPQIAYYAYGKDYHEVMKVKMQKLFDYIKSLFPDVSGRIFCDTAPILERYWAAKSGIGFIGKNTMLILPGKGSYFFLGELMLDIDLDYDSPLEFSCGKCERCLIACPTKSLELPYILNAEKCISYQTIENKNDIDENIAPLLGNCFYGCDICQKVCPWNKFSKANNTPEFSPSENILKLTVEELEIMTETDYQRIFKGSAMKRAKYSGLKRNLESLKKAKPER